MGFGNKRKQGGQKRENVFHQDKRNDDGRADYRSQQPLESVVNENFETFYRTLPGFIREDDQEDWDKFIATLRTPLPACLRVNPCNAQAATLKAQLESYRNAYFSTYSNAEASSGSTSAAAAPDTEATNDTGDKVEGASKPATATMMIDSIKWFPGGNAFKVGTDRKTIRKSPELVALHEWLKAHTNNGNITRQEAVSMVPPLALDVQPWHKVLDTCAAPGSKTTQILEVITSGIVNTASSSAADNEAEAPQGFVVANDANTDRAYMLVHQCRRLCSPYLMVTTHQGQSFPTIKEHGEPVFDRILCDVPCSGDGTLRKNPIIWGKWTIGGSHSLHPLQLLIATRALQLLRPGGLLVYSTCSMSPFEDEAVVAELLRTHRGDANGCGALELVDARQFIPGFKARAGISSWHVLDEPRRPNPDSNKRQRVDGGEGGGDDAAPAGDAELIEAEGAAAPVEEVPEPVPESSDPRVQACTAGGRFVHYPSFEAVPERLRRRIRASAFPPTAEEAAWMNLRYAMRCAPQDEDSGGFFVATFRKRTGAETSGASRTAQVAPSAAKPVAPTEAAAPAADVAASESVPSDSAHVPNVSFRQWDNKNYERVRDFYGFATAESGAETTTTVPAHRQLLPNSFYFRDEPTTKGSKDDGLKTIYFVPHGLNSLMSCDGCNKLKVVSVGIKAFERQKPNQISDASEPEYRVVQEGIAHLAPYFSKRKVQVSAQDVCNMLEGGLVSYHTLSESTVRDLNAMPHSGALVCEYHYRGEDVLALSEVSAAPADMPFYVVGWKGKSRTLNVMASKVDLEAIKIQLQALGVYRPKLSKADMLSAATSASEAAATSMDDNASTDATTSGAVGTPSV